MASRRDLFRTLLKPAAALPEKEEKAPLRVRPPYVVDASLFQSLCAECESKACGTACEESIIVIAAEGDPVINFAKGGCTFCDACADACEAGVLDKERGPERIAARFVIDVKSCMAHHGTICFSCKEPCLDDAILFNGLFNPVIDMDRCTACGFCLDRCPTRAISYEATA
jgi:ferredoxin-type protein NapF